ERTKAPCGACAGCDTTLQLGKSDETMGTNDTGSGSINAPEFSTEVGRGERFEFGKNWQRFLSVLDDSRIAEAERSLQEMLEVTTMEGKTFLDVGSGSGLFSLAAMR